jgi:hypothetical protein
VKTDNVTLTPFFKRVAAPDPIEGVETLLSHSRQQRWQDHSVWREDFTEVVGYPQPVAQPLLLCNATVQASSASAHCCAKWANILHRQDKRLCLFM